MKTITTFFVCCLAALALNSCMGVQADISIRDDGSGKIALEYRVSPMLESLGKLDGNERWPTIPVGKIDFERSAARIPGLRLTSFSAKETRTASGGKDIVTKATLEFKDTAALLAFLDNSGGAAESTAESTASLVQDNGKKVLRLTLLEPFTGVDDPDLIALMKEIAAGYEIGISLAVPKNAILSVVPASVSAARLVSEGKKVSFAINAQELPGLTDGLALEIIW